jgi:hypothetical protein
MVTCPNCGGKFVVTQNVSPPGTNTICGTLWGVFNTLKGTNGGVNPTRTQVLTYCITKGFNPSTVLTQYGRWVKYTRG